MVHDLSLVVSGSVMGFVCCREMGLLNLTLLYAKYLQDLWHSCVLYSLSSCCNCLYFVNPEGSKKVQASFPIVGLSVSLLVQRSQDGVDLAVGSIFMKYGLSLALCKANLATVLAPSSLTVQAQLGEGCGMQTENPPSTCRAWWHHETIPSFPLISSPPGFWL